MSTFYAAVMAGGSGTRFWPMSRRERPKQLLPLLSDESMIRETVRRLFPLFDGSHVYIFCNRLYRDQIQNELEGLVPPDNVIAEPIGRDSAAAIGLAATLFEWRDPGSTFAVLTSDHEIAPPDRFQRALRAGYEAAQSGALATFGVPPKYAATGYGYLERGVAVGKAWRVERFCEKPDAARAEQFLASGRHFWNSGMFVWQSRAILKELERHLLEHHRALGEIREALGTSRLPEVLDAQFPRIPKISIDYGVMEKAERVVMVEVDFLWDDVGSWREVAKHQSKDAEGNAVQGQVVTFDTQDSTIFSTDDGHLIGVVAMKDVIIVHTKDATLVCPKERSEDVKRLVETMRARGLEAYL